MIITFSKISRIFSDFIKNPEADGMYNDKIQDLIYLTIKINKILWDLEDSARLYKLGDRHVAETKKKIDINNQLRNNLITEIDTVLYKLLNIVSSSPDKFYSESPGMIIDRLSIIFIKLSVIQKIVSFIKEKNLKLEYLDKEKILLSQINNIGVFLDNYIDKLIKRDVFFEVQQPIKVYNDLRIKKYIKSLNEV